MTFIQNLTLKARLVVLVVLLGLFMLLIGGMGVVGMRDANDALNTVYRDRLIPTGQISQVTALMHDNRAQLLLALQHDPDSRFRALHDHPWMRTCSRCAATSTRPMLSGGLTWRPT